MKLGCGAWILVWAVVAAGLTLFFNQRFPGADALASDTPRLRLVIGAGLLGGLFVVFGLSTFASAWAMLREQGQLDRAWEGKLPADGAHGAFYGPIRRDGPPLAAPVTGRECLLYRYQVTHEEQGLRMRRGGSTTSETRTVVDAEGFALTPSTIATASGSLKLLTIVQPEFTPERFNLDEVREKLGAYLAGARLTGTGSLDADLPAAERLLKDTGGAVRYDRGSARFDPGKSYTVTEHVVQTDDYVCAFGTYSAEKGGVVADAGSAEVIPARLRKGPIESVSRGLGLGAAWRVVGGVAWIAAAVAGAWAFLRYGPSWW